MSEPPSSSTSTSSTQPTNETQSKLNLVTENHINYLLSLNKNKLDFEYAVTAHLRVSGIYWTLSSLYLLNQLGKADKKSILEFLAKCFVPNRGSWGGNIDHDGHLLYTLSAVQILWLLDSIELLDTPLYEPLVHIEPEKSASLNSFEKDLLSQFANASVSKNVNTKNKNYKDTLESNVYKFIDLPAYSTKDDTLANPPSDDSNQPPVSTVSTTLSNSSVSKVPDTSKSDPPDNLIPPTTSQNPKINIPKISTFQKSSILTKRQAILKYLQSLQDPVDGSIMGDEWGEKDTRFVYAALLCARCLGIKDFSTIFNVDKLISWLNSCKNIDGSFGRRPGSESHGAQVFTVLSAFSLLGCLEKYVDSTLLGFWFSERQNIQDGGLNGRPEKKSDSCYTWWILSSLAQLNKLDWISKPDIFRFVLNCQDLTNGGFADRSGDCVDVYHTFFSLAGLSLLEFPGIQPINPTYALPNSIVKKIEATTV